MEFLSVTTGLSVVVLLALLFAPREKKTHDQELGKQSNGHNGSFRSERTKYSNRRID